MRDGAVVPHPNGTASTPWGDFVELTESEREELEQLRRSLAADTVGPGTGYLSSEDVDDLMRLLARSSAIVRSARARLDPRPSGLS
jgi:hypothetical protein